MFTITINQEKINVFPLAFMKLYKDDCIPQNSKCFRDFQFVVWQPVCFLLMNFIKKKIYIYCLLEENEYFLPPHCSVWLSHLCICPLLSYLARGIAFVLRLIHLFNCISQAQTRGGCHNHLLHCTCFLFFVRVVILSLSLQTYVV